MLAHFVRGAPPKGDQSPFGEPPALREGREILCSHPLEHLLANLLDFLTKRLTVFHGKIIQKRALQILLLQLPHSQELEEQYLAGELLADLSMKDSRAFRKEINRICKEVF